MANTYWDATGVLNLDRITPVIKALFGGMNLGPIEGGSAYIADVAEGTSRSWETVLGNLIALLGEEYTQAMEDIHQACPDQVVEDLAAHLGIAKPVDTFGPVDPDEDVDMATLFALADALDDGHGLRSISLEGAWHCDRPRLGEFGGYATYVGSHVNIDTSTSRAASLGGELEAALAADDRDAAAKTVATHIDAIVGGIYDDAVAQDVRKRIAHALGKEATPCSL